MLSCWLFPCQKNHQISMFVCSSSPSSPSSHPLSRNFQNQELRDTIAPFVYVVSRALNIIARTPVANRYKKLFSRPFYPLSVLCAVTFIPVLAFPPCHFSKALPFLSLNITQDCHNELVCTDICRSDYKRYTDEMGMRRRKEEESKKRRKRDERDERSEGKKRGRGRI